MSISKTSDHIQIKIKILNLNQESLVSLRAPNQDVKDMDVLCTFKIKIESKTLEHGCIKDQQLYPNTDQDANPNLDPPASFKATNWDM